jgi:hypothetical protein
MSSPWIYSSNKARPILSSMAIGEPYKENAQVLIFNRKREAGLDLGNVKKIVEAHGDEVFYHPDLKRGLTLVEGLPIFMHPTSCGHPVYPPSYLFNSPRPLFGFLPFLTLFYDSVRRFLSCEIGDIPHRR